MKNYINMTKNSLKIRADEFTVSVALAIFGFIFGHIILRLVMAFDNSDDLTCFELGTVIAFMITLFTSITLNASAYANHINYAIAMGKRRRDTITAHIVFAFIRSTLATSLVYIFHIIENYICRTTYKNIPLEGNFNAFFAVEIFFAMIIILTALETFMGALQAKFGQKIFWIMWLVFMFGFSTLPSFIEKAAERTSDGIMARIGQFIIDVFSNLTMQGLAIGVSIFAVVLIVLPYVLLRKHRAAI